MKFEKNQKIKIFMIFHDFGSSGSAGGPDLARQAGQAGRNSSKARAVATHPGAARRFGELGDLPAIVHGHCGAIAGVLGVLGGPLAAPFDFLPFFFK